MLKQLFGGRGPESAVAVVAPAPSPLLQAVVRPIPGANPCGEDVTYDSAFAALAEELDKVNAVGTRVDHESASKFGEQLAGAGGRPANAAGAQNGVGRPAAPPGAGVDADLVISLSQTILSERSKDLRVAWHLAFGLARRDGLTGVAEGVAAVDLLARTYWDGLYPPVRRMTARKNAVTAGVARLSGVVEGAPVGPDDRDALQRARESLGTLGRFFETQDLADLAVLVRGLDARIGAALGRLPNAAPAASASAASTPAASTPAASTPAASVTSTGEDAAPRPPGQPAPEPNVLQSAAQAGDCVFRAAAWLRKDDPRRPLPYRLARAQRWDSLRAPESDGQKTKIEAPPLARRDYLRKLHETAQWATLLEEAEASFAQHPFHCWLDLQRLIDAALEGLGAEYGAAREAVRWELRRLLARLPGLPALTFAGDKVATRFASPATTAWLDEVTAGDAPGAGRPRANAADAVADRFTEARRRSMGGDLAGALTLLQRAKAEDASERDRFLRQFQMATLCLDAGQLPLGRALLEDLERDVDLHRLDAWDPELTLQVWSRLYDCTVALAGQAPRGGDAQHLGRETLGREAERVFSRLCRLDPARALARAQEAKRPP